MYSARKKRVMLIMCITAMTILILNSRQAVMGAKNGIELCINTVIPALFPYCVLSLTLQSMVLGKQIRILSPIERICGMPKGSGIIFILGILGGYPTGALCTEYAEINKNDAHRMTCFCNNAGPAFIFGIISAIYPSVKTLLIIWMIQICSAIITGYILKSVKPHSTLGSINVKPKKILNSAIHSMANVCCTIILFRVVIACAENWFIRYIPKNFNIILIGILELTNGIIMLKSLENELLRFIICNGVLAFGGICVALQTFSISKKTKPVYYIFGKLIQSLISMVLACMICNLSINLVIIPLIAGSLYAINTIKKKKAIAFSV